MKGCGAYRQSSPSTPQLAQWWQWAKDWEQQRRAGLSGKASQALHPCTRREKEFTPGREIIYGIARGKRGFFSRSWYLCYSVLVFGHMEVPLPLKYWNVPEDLECLKSTLWRAADTIPVMPWYKYHVRLMSGKRLRFEKLPNELLCSFYLFFFVQTRLNMPLVTSSALNKIKVCKRDLLAILIPNGKFLKPGFDEPRPCHATFSYMFSLNIFYFVSL